MSTKVTQPAYAKKSVAEVESSQTVKNALHLVEQPPP